MQMCVKDLKNIHCVTPLSEIYIRALPHYGQLDLCKLFHKANNKIFVM
jgi:hypothetical protein